MNIPKLKEHEERFFQSYPGGFQGEKMKEVAKKHKIEKMVKMVREGLTEEVFEDTEYALSMILKVITASSLVSVFEKTAFRNHIKEITHDEKALLVLGFKELLTGDQGAGFRLLTKHLEIYKLAKWPILTAPLYYSNPDVEVIIKPTTVKAVIEFFELKGIKYTTKPDYEFYKAYRACIKELKENVRPELRVENGSFCGFLMFAVGLYD